VTNGAAAFWQTVVPPLIVAERAKGFEVFALYPKVKTNKIRKRK
jgi:hypothetical protein